MEKNESLSMSDVKEVLEAANEIKEAIESGRVEFDRVEFAQAVGRAYRQMMTPDMVNRALKSINLAPLIATADAVSKALDNPKESEGNLIGMSQDFYIRDMLYKRNLDKFANLPSFDLVTRCITPNVKYESAAYKKDHQIVADFLSRFDYRAEFGKAFFNMMNAETYFCIFRDDLNKDKFILQDFPYQYAKITGRWEYGLYYAIDMNYFAMPTVAPEDYPKSLQKIINKKGKGGNSIDGTQIGSRRLWTDTSPKDGFWAFKFRPDLIAQIPYFAPIFSDAVLVPLLRSLQVNQSIAAAKKIISYEWPLQKERASSVADALAIHPNVMADIMGTMMAGMDDSIKIMIVPGEDAKAVEFKNTDADSFSNFLKTMSSLTGAGETLFNTSRQTGVQTMLAADYDRMLIESAYSQFANFLEYYVNKLTKKHMFKFFFHGDKTHLYRNRFAKNVGEAAAKGIVSPNLIANTLDMNLFELEKELEMAHGMKFDEKVLLLPNFYLGDTAQSDQGGRPEKDDGDLAESGRVTREQQSNVSRQTQTENPEGGG